MFNKKQDNTHTLTKYKSVFKQMQSPNTKWSKFWAGCVLPSYAERWAAGSSPQIRYLLASLHIMPSIIYAYIIYCITSLYIIYFVLYRSVTCWHLCILCHLFYMHISYNISHHTTLGILRHPCYVLYLCILRNLIRYTYCPPLRKLRDLDVCLYMLICVVHSQVVGLICLFAFVFL